MRCFISIDLPPEIAKKLSEVQKKLRGDLKLVEPENLHICLKFLGEVPDEKIPQISEIMREMASGFRAFDIKIAGIGGFPDSRRPRVIWAAAKADFSLQPPLDQKLSEIGFPAEKREFTAHITLARVRGGRVDLPEVGDLGVFTATEIRLKMSQLTPKGPIYTTVESAVLK